MPKHRTWRTLTEQDKKDIEAVVSWSMSGAMEQVYWDPKLTKNDKNPASIYRILNNHGCYDCHAADADMKGNKKDSPLDTFANISKFTKIDTAHRTPAACFRSAISIYSAWA